MRRGGGLVVNLLTFYSDDPSFFRLILFEYKQKEAGLIACTSNASRVLVYMYVRAAAYCKHKTIIIGPSLYQTFSKGFEQYLYLPKRLNKYSVFKRLLILGNSELR